MMRKLINSVKNLIIVSLLLSTLPACGYSQNENIKYTREGALSFDKDTVLQDISDGQSDMFTPLSSIRPGIWIDDVLPVHWSQEDYYQIAKAAFPSIWNEPLDDWNVNGMFFRLLCKHIEYGPQFGGFIFFKVDEESNPSIRFEREIIIMPQKEEIDWSVSEHSPSLFNKGIELPSVKYPVETALQMAENSGGREARSSVDNDCEIFLDLIPGSHYDGWQVGYTAYQADPYKRILFLVIDPYTGKIKVIYSR